MIREMFVVKYGNQTRNEPCRLAGRYTRGVGDSTTPPPYNIESI